MKEKLLSIAEYLESLEQRIAALENSNHALQSANLALQDTIAALQDKLDNLEPIESLEPLEPLATPSPTPNPEPVLQPVTCNLQPAPAPEPVLQPATCNLQPALGSVSNIRQAISLGDRFLFQRELFSNNGELMQKTLDELDALANLGEAEQYITRFNWDQESTTYKLFLNVLKRRF